MTEVARLSTRTLESVLINPHSRRYCIPTVNNGAGRSEYATEKRQSKANARRLVTARHGVSRTHVKVLVIVILAVFNIYFVLGYQALEREKTNALGMAIIASRGPMSESVHILNLTIDGRRIDAELWHALQQDLIWQSRLCPVIATLDAPNRVYWMQIQDAVVDLERVVNMVEQTYANMHIRTLNLTDMQTRLMVEVRDALAQIAANTFSREIVLGSDPKVAISDQNMRTAAEAAVRLSSGLEKFQEYLTPVASG